MPMSNRILAERAAQQQRILGERTGGSGVGIGGIRMGANPEEIEARREQAEMMQQRRQEEIEARREQAEMMQQRRQEEINARHHGQINGRSLPIDNRLHHDTGHHNTTERHRNDIRHTPTSHHDPEHEEYEREMKALFHAAEESSVSDQVFKQMEDKIRAKHFKHADLEIRLEKASKLRKARSDPSLMLYKKNIEELFKLAQNPRASDAEFRASVKKVRDKYKNKGQKITDRIASAEKIRKKTVQGGEKPNPQQKQQDKQQSTSEYRRDMQELYKLAGDVKAPVDKYQTLVKKIKSRYGGNPEVQARLEKVETLHKATRGNSQAKYKHDINQLMNAAKNPKRFPESTFKGMMQSLKSKHGNERDLKMILESATVERKKALEKYGSAGLKAVACAKLGVKTSSSALLCNATTGKPLPPEKQPKQGQKEAFEKTKREMQADATTLNALAKNPGKKDEYVKAFGAFRTKYPKLGRDLAKSAERLHATIQKPEEGKTLSPETFALKYKKAVQNLFNSAKLGHEDGNFEKQLEKVKKFEDRYKGQSNVQEFIQKRITAAEKLHERMKRQNQQKVKDKKATFAKQEQQRLAKKQQQAQKNRVRREKAQGKSKEERQKQMEIEANDKIRARQLKQEDRHHPFLQLKPQKRRERKRIK